MNRALLSIGLLLRPPAALAQDYRFPASDEDYGEFYPTAYKDHSGYDWACGDVTYSGHRGSDFGAGGFAGMEAGRTIVAAAEGVVSAVNDGEWDECTTGDCDGGGGYGNYVWIQHPDGKATLYAHLKQWSVAVSVGEFVECGTPLGEMGSSGYSTGPHLHFGVYAMDGSFHDPFVGDCASPPSYWVDQGEYGGLPAATCEDVAACAPEADLRCGDTLSGHSAGGEQAHAYYGCSSWLYSGSERAFTFATDQDESVTLTVTGLSADLDVYVLASDACDASDCLAWSEGSEASDETLTFSASAGHAYTVVLDGFEGAESAFVLSASCQGAWPSDEPEDTGGAPADTNQAGGGDSPGDTADHGPATGPPGERTKPSGGCGCGTTTAPGPSALLPLVLALASRRRGAAR